MAGIYVHIPFCRHACHYCDFHFSTSLGRIEDMHQAIIKELKSEKGQLLNQEINTIYFGGGTPSLFKPNQLNEFLKTIFENYQVSSDPEITLEANPEDLSDVYLSKLLEIGVNRLSVGIQSFDDETLQFLNRKHTGDEAKFAISRAQKIGFQNITGDLILGVPNSQANIWKKDIEQLVKLNLPHLSLYVLTIEEQTAFGNWKKKGKLVELSEDLLATQYEYAQTVFEQAGYIQYEVSNYALPGFESQHNTSYWKGAHYLGVGPGAHSFNGVSRSYNVSDNSKYLRSSTEGLSTKTVEVLTTTQQMNEYLLTRMRTKAGASISEFKRLFNRDFSLDFDQVIQQLKAAGYLEILGDFVSPTHAGFLVADEISLQLFYEEE